MGNAHAVNIHPPSCSRIVEEIRRKRRRRRCDARGAFPTFDDGSFPSQLSRSTTLKASEKALNIHPRQERRRWKCGVQRIKNIGSRRRKQLDTVTESEEEETVCFYKPGEEEAAGLQESVWKVLDNRDLAQQRRRRLDTLSESEEDESMLLYRKAGKKERGPQNCTCNETDREREQRHVLFLI